MSSDADKLVSLPTAAEACGISTRTLKRLIEEHNIPVSQPRFHKRVRVSDVAKYVKGEAPKSAPKLSREAEWLLS